jgi:hypothetical protein
MFSQFDYVVMLKVLEHTYFSRHGLADVWVFFFSLFKLFDCNYAASFSMLSFEHLAISALAYDLQDAKFIHF